MLAVATLTLGPLLLVSTEQPAAAAGPALAVGTLLVADTLDNQVLEMAPGAGGTATTIGTALDEPSDVAVNPAGDVYIADTSNSRVVELPAGGGSQTTVGKGLVHPAGVAVDSDGNVYIADTGNDRVVEVNATTRAQATLASDLDDPTSVAVDAAGDVFIANFGGDDVIEIPADGSENIDYGGLSEPDGLAVDAAGDAFVTELGAGDVVEITADGAETTVASGFDAPDGLAVDGDGDLFVSDYGDGSAGTGAVYEEPAGGAQTKVSIDGLKDPAGLAVYAPPPAFTADTPPAATATSASYGYTYAATSESGEPAPTFQVVSGSAPSGLTLDATTGELYGFPAGTGTFTFTVAAENVATSALTPSTTITVNQGLTPGTLLVADQSDDVHEVPPNGGTQVQLNLGLNGAPGVGVDSQGDVFVPNNRGDTLLELTPAGTTTVVASGLDNPLGAAVDDEGDVFIANDGASDVVQRQPAAGVDARRHHRSNGL
ncbi:MAG: putative Ig domain-containing protein [Acidimicrobiales bacterium]